MTPQQKVLVRTTFDRIAPSADEVAAMFYRRLFELDPTLRPLFKGDLREQGRKLMQMLSVAVRGLNRLDELVPAVEQLGQGHVRYGVQDSHYESVAAALLWTLEQGLGSDFTPEVGDAWATVYHLLAGTMKGGAATAA